MSTPKEATTRCRRWTSGRTSSWCESWSTARRLCAQRFLQIASEPLTFEKGVHLHADFLLILMASYSRLDGDSNESYGRYNSEDEPPANPNHRQVLRRALGSRCSRTRYRVCGRQGPTEPSERRTDQYPSGAAHRARAHSHPCHVDVDFCTQFPHVT